MKKFITIIILMSVIISSVILPVCAASDLTDADATVTAASYKDPDGSILCAARKGYWKNAPENSLSSIAAAVNNGADIVEIDVKKTADGVLILMADDTVTRTCYGYGENTKVSEMNYDEITRLNLLMGEGGANAEKTQQTVPTLDDVLSGNYVCLFLIDADWELRDDIYRTLAAYDMLEYAIFLIRSANSKEIDEWKDSLDSEIMTMAYFKGNIIFSAVSAVKKAAETSEGIYLASKNPYGVVFGETVMDNVQGKVRAMANAAEEELNGSRQDTAIYWDDLISRGYSIILTDNVPELREYIASCNSVELKLKNVYDKLVTNWELPDFNSDKFFDYKLAYTDAVTDCKKILSDGSSAKSDIETAIYELQKAYADINANYEELETGTAGMTVTPTRILLCLLAVAAVTAVEIFFYKRKKKD